MAKRILYLEGLRGIMSLNVVLNHFIVVFYPALYFIGEANKGSIQDYYAKSPFQVISNGNVAVHYFFILSGFLITFSIFNSPDSITLKSIVNKIIRKYKNILYLVFTSSLLAYILMKLNVMYHLDSINYGVKGLYINEYNNFIPTILSLLYSSFWLYPITWGIE